MSMHARRTSPEATQRETNALAHLIRPRLAGFKSRRDGSVVARLLLVRA
jgi:hypothetical protein